MRRVPALVYEKEVGWFPTLLSASILLQLRSDDVDTEWCDVEGEAATFV